MAIGLEGVTLEGCRLSKQAQRVGYFDLIATVPRSLERNDSIEGSQLAARTFQGNLTLDIEHGGQQTAARVLAIRTSLVSPFGSCLELPLLKFQYGSPERDLGKPRRRE